MRAAVVAAIAVATGLTCHVGSSALQIFPPTHTYQLRCSMGPFMACLHRRPDLSGGRQDVDRSIDDQKCLVGVRMEYLCGGQTCLVDAPTKGAAHLRAHPGVTVEAVLM